MEFEDDDYQDYQDDEQLDADLEDQEYFDLDQQSFQDPEKFSIPINLSSGKFHSEVEELAKYYINRFFDGKMLYCGGKIPRSYLFAKDKVSMVLNFDICAGCDYVYATLEKSLSKYEIDSARITGEVTSDIKLVRETLDLIAKSGVPQQFAGGIMVLYLELVEGVEFAE